MYVHFLKKRRQTTEFMAFGACQAPRARRPGRASQAQTVGEFRGLWWLNPKRRQRGWTLAWQPVGGKAMARATPSARFLETEPRRWKNETLKDRLRPQKKPYPLSRSDIPLPTGTLPLPPALVKLDIYAMVVSTWLVHFGVVLGSCLCAPRTRRCRRPS